MAKWTKKTYKLDAMYGWECKPGYTIFVAERGAVRFDFPQEWHFDPGEGAGSALKFYDRQPPDDDCVLQVSYFHIPPGMPFNWMPLRDILIEVSKEPEQGELHGPLVNADRDDLDLIWREMAHMEDGRDARSRQSMARANGIMTLMTLDYWADDSERVLPVWEEIHRTLRLGQYVRPPGPKR